MTGEASSLKPLRFSRAIFYCRSAQEIDECCTLLTPSTAGKPFLGFDIEWFVTFEAGVAPRKVATIQLCNEECCGVFQVSAFPGGSIPRSLRTLLEDWRIPKVGVGASRDAIKIKDDHGVDVNGVINLEDMASRVPRSSYSSSSLQSNNPYGPKSLAHTPSSLRALESRRGRVLHQAAALTRCVSFLRRMRRCVEAMAAGGYHSMILKHDGSVWSTGSNNNSW